MLHSAECFITFTGSLLRRVNNPKTRWPACLRIEEQWDTQPVRPGTYSHWCYRHPHLHFPCAGLHPGPAHSFLLPSFHPSIPPSVQLLRAQPQDGCSGGQGRTLGEGGNLKVEKKQLMPEMKGRVSQGEGRAQAKSLNPATLHSGREGFPGRRGELQDKSWNTTD